MIGDIVKRCLIPLGNHSSLEKLLNLISPCCFLYHFRCLTGRFNFGWTPIEMFYYDTIWKPIQVFHKSTKFMTHEFRCRESHVLMSVFNKIRESVICASVEHVHTFWTSFEQIHRMSTNSAPETYDSCWTLSVFLWFQNFDNQNLWFRIELCWTSSVFLWFQTRWTEKYYPR